MQPELERTDRKLSVQIVFDENYYVNCNQCQENLQLLRKIILLTYRLIDQKLDLKKYLSNLNPLLPEFFFS